MCRLLAYAAAEDHALAELLGPEQFDGFCALSRLHRDGWGMAWLTPGAAAGEAGIGAARSVAPAFEDADFHPRCATRLGKAGFVHLRWATGNLAVAPENTHPFVLDGWAFAHQGEIFDQERIYELMAPEWRARRRGTTDSELFFLHVLECTEREGDVIAGIQAASADILGACGSASLNSVLLSSTSLVVVCGAAGLPNPRDDLLAAVARPEDVPLDHLDGYFRLRHLRSGSSVVISSSGVPGDGWQDIPEGSILHVDIESLAVELHPLAAAPLAAGGD